MEGYNSAYSGAQVDEAVRIAVANQTPFQAKLLAAGWADTDVFGKRTNVSGGSLELNTATFKSALSDTPAVKTFTYNSSVSSWQLNGSNVSLSTYGLTLTGAPANGDIIVAEYAVLKVQTLSVTGASADYTLTCDLNFAEDGVPSEEEAQATAWGRILKYITNTNSITFYCAGTAPDVDIPIQLWEA